MNENSIARNGNAHKATQIGPPWHCFECGAEVEDIDCYLKYLSKKGTAKPLDTWGEHIWYLRLPAPCRQAGHTVRVARLGDAITPLITYEDGRGEDQAIANVREALATIAAVHGANPSTDPAAKIVYRLVAGAITPGAAVEEVRELCHSGVLGALEAPDQDLAFQEVANG